MARREKKNNRIVFVAAIVSIGVDSDARRREVLALGIGLSEILTFRTDFPRQLRRGVKRVAAAAHEGIKAAVAKAMNASSTPPRPLPSASVRFMRNILADASKRLRRAVSAFIAAAFAQDGARTAKAKLRKVAGRRRQKLQKLTALMDEAETDILAS